METCSSETASTCCKLKRYSPNSTWLVTSRLDTTRHVRRVERVETSVSSRDAPSGIWAYTVMLNGSIISDCSTSLGRQVANNVLLYIGSHSGADWVTGSVGRTHLPPSIPVTRLVIRSRREARSEVPAAHERKKTRCFYIE